MRLRATLPRLLLIAACTLVLDHSAVAALTVTDAPAEHSSVDHSQFSEGGDARSPESEAAFRMAEKKRAKRKSDILGILAVAGPIVVLIAGSVIFAWSKSKKRHKKRRRSEYHELKQAESRRRSGGPAPIVDPRQW